MATSTDISDSLSNLSLQNDVSRIDELHQNRSKTNKVVLAKQFNDILNREMIVKSHGKVLDILLCISDHRVFLRLLLIDESLTYVKLLKPYLKKDSEHLEDAIKLLDLLLQNFKYKYEHVSFIVPYVCPLIAEHKHQIEYILLRMYLFSKQELLNDLCVQFETLADLQSVLPSVTLLNLVFRLSPSTGRKLFESESCSEMLKLININSSKEQIVRSLELLNLVCGYKDMHVKIINGYLSYLKLGLDSTFIEIKLLTCVILAKLWLSDKNNLQDFKMEDILTFLLENFEYDYAIEALANLSLKTSIKKLLRQDDEFIFDLTKLLEDPKKTTPKLYGILSILTNLSELPPHENDNSEMAKLKRYAMAGLKEEKDDSREDIMKFNADLVERNIVRLLVKFSYPSSNLRSVILEFLTNLVDNHKATKLSCIKQGILSIGLLFFSADGCAMHHKVAAFKLIVSQTYWLTPEIIHPYIKDLVLKITPCLAWEEEQDITVRDQYYTLLTLTNICAVDGYFPENLWLVLDKFLVSENELLKKATFEIVSNLSGYEGNLVRLFNEENPSSAKRLGLVIEGTYSLNPDILCASLAALANGTVIPFITGSVFKNYPDLMHRLTTLIEPHAKSLEVIHRLVTIFQNILYGQDELFEVLKRDVTFRSGIEMLKNKYQSNNDISEIVIELDREMKQ
ncbi:hypothetical protein WICPIJ_002808 [Wickerhamomyces pijperi]|uniref:UNC-45/Cro1/She4 central domain-containing protein n=1 Tax=Wickerhamomyces pijperi TaxID=599730 RepID=A0A9P8QAY9_WICPI|nr:hypothetical protein WICPIJ_002808 [Wickerhamomyces pijperi]